MGLVARPPQVLLAAVGPVVRATNCSASGIRYAYTAAGAENPFASQPSRLYDDDNGMLEPQSPCRPFEQLRRLAITIDAAAVAPLAQLLPLTPTGQSVEILDRAGHGGDF
jgi:hypothetical protein